MIILGIILVIIIATISWAISTYNSFISHEQTVKARYKTSQASLTNAVNTLKTMGISTQKYIDSFTTALKSAIEGRWGPGGAKQVIAAITEQNPTLPPDVITKLQNVTEEVYADFYASNVATIDADRAYMSQVKSFPAVIIANMFRFPSSEYTAAKYDQVIMNAESKKAFETGTMEHINPFEEKK